ncbi:MAG: radical SAM protein [Candidatus Hydrogenedentes bacterium]|nr:radical SAM protein [Candidatus Hydrogenedentota bacterium]
MARESNLQQTLRINEIYESIQGESTWAGLPCTFVRLARCPLRCTWCDTQYAFYGGETVQIGEILGRVAALSPTLVELTGGEPLVQHACPVLAEELIRRGYTVLVETSGSLPIDVLPDEAIAIMDLKCPDSGECDSNHWPNIDALRPDRDEVKFVLASRRDYEWSRDVIRTYTLESRCRAVLMSAVFGRIEPRQIVEWILADRLPVRFQLQLHKFIWAPNAKGV